LNKLKNCLYVERQFATRRLGRRCLTRATIESGATHCLRRVGATDRVGLLRITASTRLSIEAEYRGWELTRVRLYTDGSRRVLLRRRKIAGGQQSARPTDQPGL
jgi:hypothetical protein